MSPLTEEQRSELKERLLAMRVALQQRSQAAAEDTRPVSLDQPIGRLTRMDAIQQQHMALGQQKRREQEQQQIEAALHRLESNRYGLCVRCEEEVSYDRLKARPTTTLCRNCQDEIEAGSKRIW